jgi:exocyst complex component 2
VENAEHPVVLDEGSEWILAGSAAQLNGPDSTSPALAADAVDSQDRVSPSLNLLLS